MGVVGVGAILLVLALIVYLRMISARMKARDRGGRADQMILDQAETLADFGREQDAMRLLEEALRERPDSGPIRARLEWMRAKTEE